MIRVLFALVACAILFPACGQERKEGFLVGWSGGTGGGDYVFLVDGRRFACAYDKLQTREVLDTVDKRLKIGQHAVIEFIRPLDATEDYKCLATYVRFTRVFDERLVKASQLSRDFIQSVYNGKYDDAYSLLSANLRRKLKFQSFVLFCTNLDRTPPGWTVSIADLLVGEASERAIEVIVDPRILRPAEGNLGLEIVFERPAKEKPAIGSIRTLSKWAFADLFEHQ